MNSTAKAFRKNIELNIVEYLREYADAAEASGSPHWAVAMREASNQLQRNHPLKTSGVGEVDAHGI